MANLTPSSPDDSKSQQIKQIQWDLDEAFALCSGIKTTTCDLQADMDGEELDKINQLMVYIDVCNETLAKAKSILKGTPSISIKEEPSAGDIKTGTNSVSIKEESTVHQSVGPSSSLTPAPRHDSSSEVVLPSKEKESSKKQVPQPSWIDHPLLLPSVNIPICVDDFKGNAEFMNKLNNLRLNE